MTHYSPMRMQWPNPKTIPCKDCVFRDRTSIEIDGQMFFPGITRDTCGKYDGIRGNWKPSKLLFLNEPCKYYKKDVNANDYHSSGAKRRGK